MKRVILTLLITAIGATAYASSPFVTAFRIGEAIKAGDSAYLAGKVEWGPVRDSLRRSVGPVAMGISDPGAGGTLSYWQRVKLRLSQRSIDRAVNGYVTPQGLPQLFTYGRAYRRLKGQVEPPRTLANLPERIGQTWSRLKRGVFIAPTLVEIEAEDRYSPERHYVGRLQLQGLEWRLVSLSVKLVPDLGELAQAEAEMQRALAAEGTEVW